MEMCNSMTPADGKTQCAFIVHASLRGWRFNLLKLWVFQILYN
jgi:hypothetical protein